MRVRLLAAMVACSLSWVGLSSIAGSQQSPLPSAIVAIGDSYISGEAAGDYVAGTDTDTNQCHRSSRSLIEVAAEIGATDVAINLACSGSTTAELRIDGLGRGGEQAQLTQLQAVVETYDVRAVVVSIGGNDLGFGGMIRDCVFAYLPFVADCGDGIESRLPALLEDLGTKLRLVLDDVGTALGDDSSAEVVLLSYPSPVTEQIRTPWLRLAMGCPFTLNDLAYARTGLIADVAAEWEAVAQRHGVRFLDLSRAFEGHEVCSEQATFDTEWAKGIFVNTAQIRRGIGTNVVGQSLHPNAQGHAQIGRCLSQFLSMTDPSAICLADDAATGDLAAMAPQGAQPSESASG